MLRDRYKGDIFSIEEVTLIPPTQELIDAGHGNDVGFKVYVAEGHCGYLRLPEESFPAFVKAVTGEVV